MEDEELRAAVEDEAREPLNEFEEEQEAAEEGGEEQAPEEEPPEEQPEEEPEPQPEPPPPPKRRAAGKLALFVTVNNNRHPQRVSGERFLIGRGKHCNLVIDSNRVSREHAAISRQGNEIVIEDLKSSNGTWYNRQRIARRKIDDGDEFLLGTEKLTFSFRSG
ncbi:MAG: FHA domain-containing protein [Myxococcales bacterium]|nr:FHA domain-containing protein [Myxococcales bacterium]